MKTKVIVQELRRIAAQNDGLLKPQAVVSAAKPANSPLHGCFIWDDTEAAAAYRLWQARELISVTVKVIELNGKKTPIRYFVSLGSDRTKGAGYREMTVVLRSQSMRAILLADALAELKAFESKYRSLHELASVFREASKIMAQ